MNPSILKSAVQADYPDFTERQIGLRRFSDVLRALEKEKLLKAKIPCAKRTEDPKSPDQHSALRQNGTAFLFAH